ncbi:MAG: hypothetical protein JWR72_2433 [Flavisolibacter sp.]|jgi:hypothetical protein|nr:hypothetical protein [Flavisolibacter sp.]
MRNSLIKSILFLSLIVLSVTQLVAQENNEAALKSLLSTKTFVFKAQSAWPLQGTVVQLNPGFDMKILIDSINTYLPYFGRAYSAGYNTGGGINFTSTKFEYKLKEKSKGGWEIVIKPADAKDIHELIYSVSTNGFATLQVTSNNRQAISFYGIIEKK